MEGDRATRRQRFLGGAAGVSGLFAGLWLVGLATAGAGVMRAELGPPLAAAMVCTLKQLASGEATCGEAGSPAPTGPQRRFLHLVQDRPAPSNRPEVIERLGPHLRWVDEYWEEAEKKLGRRYRRPQVDVDARPGGAHCCGRVILPVPGLDSYIGLLVPDGGNLEREVAGAIFSLAHLIALANLEDYAATLDLQHDHYSLGVRSWWCSERCELWRQRTLMADCAAGAAMRWALTQGRIDPATVERMKDIVRALRPDSPRTGAAAPPGWAREQWFLRGLESTQATADPYGPCGVPIS